MGLADEIAAEYAAENQADSIAAEYQKEKAGPQQGPINKYVRPVVEGVGMLGGGMLGSGAMPPFGTVAGGVLGYAGGSSLMDTIEGLAGERKPPQDVKEALHDTAGALSRGALYESVGGLAGRTTSALIPYAERITAPFASAVDRTLNDEAKEIGVALTPAEQTRSLPLSLVESVMEKVPGSAGFINKQRLGQLRNYTTERDRLLGSTTPAQPIGNLPAKFQEAVDQDAAAQTASNTVEQQQLRSGVRQELGSPESQFQLGVSAKEAFNVRTQRQRELENAGYDLVRGYAGDKRFAPEAIQNSARKLLVEMPEDVRLGNAGLRGKLEALATGSGNLKLDQALKAIDEQKAVITQQFAPLGPGARSIMQKEMAALDQQRAQLIAENPPGYTYDQLQAIRTDINDLEAQASLAFRTGQSGVAGTGNKQTRQYDILRHGIDDAIEGGLGEDGKTVWDMARSLVADRKTNMRRSEVLAVIKRDPEKASEAVIRPGAITAVTVFKQLYPDSFRFMSRSFTNRLIGDGTAVKGGAQLESELNKYGDETLRAVYGNDRDVQLLHDLATQLQKSDKPPLQNKFFLELAKSDPALVANKIVKPFSRPADKAARDAENLANLNTVEQRLGRDTVDAVKHSIAKHILEDNKLGNVSPVQVFNRFNEYGPKTMEKLFGKQGYEEFARFARVSERLASVERLAGNPSGTARNLISFGQGMAIMYNPILGATSAIAPAVLSRLYMSQRGQKLILDGMRLPAGSPDAVRVLTQIMAISNDEGLRKQLDKEMSNEPTSVVP